jgi:FdhD protein
LGLISVKDEGIKRELQVTVINGEQVESRVESVAVEASIALIINHQHRIDLIVSPNDLEDLAVGYLISEGIVSDAGQIQSVEVQGDQILVEIAKEASDVELWFEVRSSGCVGVKMQYEDLDITITSPLVVPAPTLFAMEEIVQGWSSVWRATGGCHIASVFAPDGTLLYAAEDVGRHNAMDKVIGKVFRSCTDPSQVVAITSGRLAAGLVAKAARAGFPILLSKAAALDAGVALAEQVGMTLCGFVRGQKMNVYAHPQRVLL